MKRRARRLLALSVLLLMIGAVLLAWNAPQRQSALSAGPPSLAAILAEGDAGFAEADGAWEYRFPADHGGHPEFRSEVWYLTANLNDEQGNRLGAQLAFFRLRLSPDEPDRESAWAANQVFRAHFALADAGAGRFFAAERFSRAALGLSGMEQSPVRVWLEDWSLEAIEKQGHEAGLRLRAADEGLGLELDLRSEKPPLLEGAADLFRENEGRGGFHFYVMPRLEATGVLRVGGAEKKVAGRAWLDRAWGAVPLSRGQIALNRFALQLSDGRDVLCLQLRRRDGSGTPVPSCLAIAPDGTARSFRRREIRLDPLTGWTSELDGTIYPLSWRLEIPAERLELEITPLLENQELDFATRAWSGSIAVSGSSGGKPISGRGHLELSGYTGAGEGT